MKRVHWILAAASVLLLANGPAFSQSRYVQFGDLNYAPTNIGSSWTRLRTTATAHPFAKIGANTVLEVHVNSRFSVGAISGASGVRFQIRVDDRPPAVENQGSIRVSNSSDFLSIVAVFRNVPAGNHTVSLWGEAAPGGGATSVVVDPGGWGGRIIVKESP
jgi:hypothetical protein